MKRVLYITRTGMLEPLGQSQVLPYLRKLSRDFDITLISFERRSQNQGNAAPNEVWHDCNSHGIRWKPKLFRQKWRILAASWNMSVLFLSALKEVFLRRPVLIHARAYMPAVVAMILKRVFHVPYVFDMRALWPEELITSDRLQRGSRLHKLIIWAERSCLEHAAEVVVLTYAAKSHLETIYPNVETGKYSVIPTCADLDRFVPAESQIHAETRTYGCIGSVLSGWFRAGSLAEFFHVAATQDPKARFEIITRDDPEEVRRLMRGDASFQKRLDVRPAKPAEMPGVLSKHSVNVMFYEGGATSELGRCPTRLAEALGCGLPVVAGQGVGDVEEILVKHNIGVVTDDQNPNWALNALKELDHLIDDSNLPTRCRQASEEIFGLDVGTEQYRAIYHRILSSQ